MDDQMYGILCESESGLDAFGNPKGKPLLFESVGEMMEQHKAIERASKMKASGRYGDVKVVRIEVCDYIIK